MRNPLLVAPVVAMFLPLTGLSVPSSVTMFLKLLGGVASPCAPIALGLFLANKPSKALYQPNVIIGLLVTLKLLLHPLVVWVMAT